MPMTTKVATSLGLFMTLGACSLIVDTNPDGVVPTNHAGSAGRSTSSAGSSTTAGTISNGGSGLSGAGTASTLGGAPAAGASNLAGGGSAGSLTATGGVSGLGGNNTSAGTTATTGGTGATAGRTGGVGGITAAGTGGVATGGVAGGGTGGVATGGAATGGKVGGTGGMGTGGAMLPATSVEVGASFTCVLISDKTVRCWGANDSGQLGTATSGISSAVPVAIPGLSGVAAISVGREHACAILVDKTIKCWGANNFAQVGDGAPASTTAVTTPVTVSGIYDAAEIACGSYHSCALLDTGSVKCWGGTALGVAGIDRTGTPVSPIVSTTASIFATAISSNDGHVCVLLNDHSVKCWGDNFFGQVGDPNNTDQRVFVPTLVPGITTAIGIAAGSQHTCVVLSDHTAKCWGRGDWGSLGNGGNIDSRTPVVVSGMNTAESISAGDNHSCARLGDGTLQCWGINAQGRLGDGTLDNRNVPTAVISPSAKGMVVSAGPNHTCAINSVGSPYCWGSAKLGNGSDGYSSTPVLVSGF